MREAFLHARSAVITRGCWWRGREEEEGGRGAGIAEGEKCRGMWMTMQHGCYIHDDPRAAARPWLCSSTCPNRAWLRHDPRCACNTRCLCVVNDSTAISMGRSWMRFQTAYGEQTRHPVRDYVSEMHTWTRGFAVVDLHAFWRLAALLNVVCNAIIAFLDLLFILMSNFLICISKHIGIKLHHCFILKCFYYYYYYYFCICRSFIREKDIPRKKENSV